MKTIHKAALLLTAALTLAGSRALAFTGYDNDFSEEAFPAMSGSWTLDTEGGVLNYAQPTGTSGAVIGTAAVDVPDALSESFTVSLGFTLNDRQGPASGSDGLLGFGLFGASTTFNGTAALPNYLADWTFAGANQGRIRIAAVPTRGSFSAVNLNIGAPEIGMTYELRLTAIYVESALEMTFTVFDGVGTQIGEVTAIDTAPLTGSYFGLRNRTASTSHALDVDFDYFTVQAVPEPSTVALTGLGILMLLRRWKRNA